MLFVWIVLIIIGFALLVKGADWFVDGAAGVAAKCRVSALVIGLTVVAFGTSAPELAVSVTAAIKHSTDISIGNVVGSNIVNILLILGVSALIRRLPVQRESLKLDLPFLVVASVLLVVLGCCGQAIRWYDGVIMLAVFAVYLAILITNARRNRPQSVAEAETAPRGKVSAWYFKMRQNVGFLIALTAVGLVMVVGGGTLLVDGARYIAEYFGVSERIIGLTVVALGTSLPELVTSVVAAAKGETDIAVGNIIGSNIFNIFLVAGVASLFYPLTFTAAGNLLDALVALASALLLFVFAVLSKRHTLGRAAGAVMLSCFAAYYVYLFLA